MRTTELTDKQKAFVEAYCISWDATKAALAAGYASKSASSKGCQLVKHNKIAEEIERRKQQIRAKNKDEVAEIKARLRSKAFDDDLSERDQLRALELLGKSEAMFSERHILTPELPQLSQEEISTLREHSAVLRGVTSSRRVLTGSQSVDSVVIPAEQPIGADQPAEAISEALYSDNE